MKDKNTKPIMPTPIEMNKQFSHKRFAKMAGAMFRNLGIRVRNANGEGPILPNNGLEFPGEMEVLPQFIVIYPDDGVQLMFHKHQIETWGEQLDTVTINLERGFIYIVRFPTPESKALFMTMLGFVSDDSGMSSSPSPEGQGQAPVEEGQ